MTSTQSENNKYDQILYVYSFLKRLGCGDVNTFEQRLTSQKIQYFAQLFGVSMRYPYNLYLNGPYSPQLAHDLYQIKELKMKPMVAEFAPEILENRYQDLKKFLKEMTARHLELTATLHWFLKVAGMDKKATIEKLQEFKKANNEEIEYATNKLHEYEQIKKSYK